MQLKPLNQWVTPMLSPEYLDHIADDLLELYGKLDEAILRDIVRRMLKTGKVTDTAAWQIDRLQQSGLLKEDIISDIAKYSNDCDAQVKALFEEAGIKSVDIEREIYEQAGLYAPPIRMSPQALDLLKAGLTKTNGQIKNLTLTTAITSQQAYIEASTLAEMQVESGMLDYQTAIRRAVKQASEASTTVSYPSGHIDRLDVAIRRAVLTGTNQTMGQVSLQYAEEFGCDIMELTAHAGARPSHAAWQGKLVSLSGKRGYLTLMDIGYGSGPGFMGWNCRHSWNPFFPGISTPNYTKKRLNQLEEKRVEYNGEKYTDYEASQIQRQFEREIRASKRILAGLDEGVKQAKNEPLRNGLQADFNMQSLKLKEQETKLKDMLKQTNRLNDSSRSQVQGFGRSTAQKAVQADKNLKFIKEDATIKANSGLPKKIDLPDERIRQTVLVESDRIHGVVPKGALATEVYAMAGVKTGKNIRDLNRLYTQYPEYGPASGWQKKSGTVNTDNFRYVAHWYENNRGVPEGEIKLKGVKRK